MYPPPFSFCHTGIPFLTEPGISVDPSHVGGGPDLFEAFVAGGALFPADAAILRSGAAPGSTERQEFNKNRNRGVDISHSLVL